ncbi:MAG: hypothetical protein Q4A59_01870 [Erysipelotrichaceae bacterium]|nr:hypothetical protein [Erysipelotrichaceae bacterium]
MKRYLLISIGTILFGISTAYFLEFIQHWFLIGCFAIYCSSLFVLFATSAKEALIIDLMYSTSLFLSRYFLTHFDLVPAIYVIATSSLACALILFLTQSSVKINALRSFVSLIFILFLINQPKTVFYIGLFAGLLIFVNMSLQVKRTDFSKHHIRSLKSHYNFQERIAARNRLTTNLIVQSVCAEYNKLEKCQVNRNTNVL